jgi:DNA-binding HxlR family transcriptional regulator
MQSQRTFKHPLKMRNSTSFVTSGPNHAFRGWTHGKLTVRLHAFEAEGLVYREFTPNSPLEATYGLTAMAAEVGAIPEELHHVANRVGYRTPE